MKISAKLELWKKRLAESDGAFGAEVAKMDERERIYNGSNLLKPLVPGDARKDGSAKRTSHVRNIVFENIESQVSSSIPQPKVTPRHKEDERLAGIIEHALRNELDRLPFETINDMMERTVPIQGGAGLLVEWDNGAGTHTTVGEVAVSAIHPKQFAPQPGVFTGIEDMDWFILKIPTTKEAVRRQFGKAIPDENESEPEVRSPDGADQASDAVTRYIGFARNDHGGLDRYSWVNDIELEDVEDYQARRGTDAEGNPVILTVQTVLSPIGRDGQILVEAQSEIPCYKPDLYPIVLQRSVSVYGKLLGNSDVDVIRDQQNTINRLEQKINDRLIKAGTRITLPDRADLRTDPEDGERWYIGSPADKALIDLYDFSGNLQYEMAYLEEVYQEARQILGITDSFQGRKDATATSGKAKEFSAAQAAGRLESKRVMKNAAYATLFEMIFKLWLAYSDEPRAVSYKDFRGETRYEEFNRYDFLKQDANGEWYWNDQFLFSVDSSAPLENNREGMWQELRLNLQSGAFGDPSQLDTLILFWAQMEEQHYPGAGITRKYLEDKQQQLMAEQQMAAQQVAQPQTAQPQGQQIPQELAQAIEQRAQQAALRDVLARQQQGTGGVTSA